MSHEAQRLWAQEMLNKLQVKMPYGVKKAQEIDGVPYTAAEGAWVAKPSICWWTNGFWPASMMQMFALTGEKLYLDEARRTEEMLDGAFRDYYGLHHDVGFMWRISSGFDWQLTGDEKNLKRTLLAASMLASRFNPNGFIRAWNGEEKTGWAIIDCMMNLSVLYFAAEYLHDPRFSLIAQKHADTVQRVFIRKDGTSEHIVCFDPVTGEVLEKRGGQGWKDGSVWSRGQAWAIYGFAISHRHTGRADYLKTACRVADAFIELVQDDWLPACDLVAPKEPVIKDDCAGAIAACGMLEIAEMLGEGGEKYREAAFRLLTEMEKHHADWTENSPAIFTHCTEAYSKGHHMPMTYGDYYFIEAVARLLGGYKLYW